MLNNSINKPRFLNRWFIWWRKMSLGSHENGNSNYQHCFINASSVPISVPPSLLLFHIGRTCLFGLHSCREDTLMSCKHIHETSMACWVLFTSTGQEDVQGPKQGALSQSLWKTVQTMSLWKAHLYTLFCLPFIPIPLSAMWVQLLTAHLKKMISSPALIFPSNRLTNK